MSMFPDLRPLQFQPSALALLGLALLCVFALYRFKRSRRIRLTTVSRARAPATRGFVCVRCARQSLHSKRTLSDWEGGSRRFACNGCHAQVVDPSDDESLGDTRLPDSVFIEDHEHQA